MAAGQSTLFHRSRHSMTQILFLSLLTRSGQESSELRLNLLALTRLSWLQPEAGGDALSKLLGEQLCQLCSSRHGLETVFL